MKNEQIRFGPLVIKLTFRCHVAWWLQPYLTLVHGFSELTGLEPDIEKVKRMVDRGIRVDVQEGRIER